MILQSLAAYYDRLAEDGGEKVAPPGFETLAIPFIIVLDLDGRFLELLDTRMPSGKNLVARSFIVSKDCERSGKKAWQAANILWDHFGYVLGWPKSGSDEDKEMAQKQHATFKSVVDDLHDKYPDDEEIQAVRTFLFSDNISKIFSHRIWPECAKIPGCKFSFKIGELNRLVCESETIKNHVWKMFDRADDENEGKCMVTGERDSIARLHPRTPIRAKHKNARTKSNAKLVSFQKNMGFDSYGKQQCYNAPIGKRTAFAYTTALNRLLANNSRQKIAIGDTTTVFWAEIKNELEESFGSIFDFTDEGTDGKEAANRKRSQYINALLNAPARGHQPSVDEDSRFYVLGLAPNAARISVRFWYAGPVKEVEENIRSHFSDLEIGQPKLDKNHPAMWRLLKSLALKGDTNKLPPNLAGDWMASILKGNPYPKTLLMAALRRVRAEREIGSQRASIIKGCLNRDVRYYNRNEKEVTVSLDESNQNVGYVLGRLFAALERCQARATPGLNATIRDKFYGSASTTPVVAFAHLMKLNKHHLAKLENKEEAFNLKLIAGIVDNVASNGFPAHLSLEDQGRFAVGYYHQTQRFYRKKGNGADINNETSEED